MDGGMVASLELEHTVQILPEQLLRGAMLSNPSDAGEAAMLSMRYLPPRGLH